MKCDIGHFEIKAGGRCYNLIPSFENIMTLGNPKELVELYNSIHAFGQVSDVHSSKQNYMYCIGDAARIIRACSDQDPSSVLIDIIRTDKGLKLHFGAGERLTPEQQVIIAAGLMRHGVAGVYDRKKSNNKGKAAEAVDLWEFVHAAMAHLDMQKSDALALTMTEFTKIMQVKFPQENDFAGEISDDEYDQAMAMMNRQRVARGEEEWQSNH